MSSIAALGNSRGIIPTLIAISGPQIQQIKTLQMQAQMRGEAIQGFKYYMATLSLGPGMGKRVNILS